MTDFGTQPALFPAEDNMITLYGQPGCGPCHGVRRKLEKAKVPYEYVDLSENQKQQARLQTAGYQQTPIIETPTERFSGNDPEKIDQAIEEVHAIETQRQQQTMDLDRHQGVER